MKYIFYILVLQILCVGCGGAESTPVVNNPAPSDESASNTTQLLDASPSASGSPSATPQPYTNSFGNIFCNVTSSDMNCFGDVTLQTTQLPTAFVIGQEAVCVTYSGYQIDSEHIGGFNLQTITDLECYSAGLGPVAMSPKIVRGSPGSMDSESFQNVTVNYAGEICLEVHGGNAINTYCGFAPTSNGGIQ